MISRVRVKICGITNEADARAAIALGTDALGFNLWPGSKRHIDLVQAGAWVRELPPFVTRVAVLVNVALEEARQIAAHPAIDMLQFHGDEDARYCAAFAESGFPFIKALRIRDAGDLSHADAFSTKNVLLDAHADGAYGGTGTRLPLTLAAAAVARFPELKIILAGGLTAENVTKAIHEAQPYAVDVASGVESGPGQKDLDKLERFLSAVTT
jgi:phosphoribosylanthranilate isomerase